MSAPVTRENRKVQITGKSSCMVSLPMRWVKEMGLVQGSSVTIKMQTPNSLLITPKNAKNEKKNRDVGKLVIGKAESPEATVRKITCLYVQGYSLIHVRFADTNPLNPLNASAVKDMIRNWFIGVEILGESQGVLMLQVLLGKSDISTDNLIKQMSVVSSEMQRDAVSALISFNRRRAMDLNERSDIERIDNYLNRLAKSCMNNDVSRYDDESCLGTSPTEYLLLARSICHASVSAKSIAGNAISLDRPLESETCTAITLMSQFACNLFDQALLAYFKKDLDAAEKTIENAKHFTTLEMEFVIQNAGMSFGQNHVISSTLNALGQIVRESVTISEIVLRLTVNQIESVSAPGQSNDDFLLIEAR